MGLYCNKCGKEIGTHKVTPRTGFACPGKPHIKVVNSIFCGRVYFMYAGQDSYYILGMSRTLEGLK